MNPTYQSLHAYNLTSFQTMLWLIVNLKFLAGIGCGITHVFLHVQTPEGGTFHVVVVISNPVFSCFLRLVKGNIRLLYQFCDTVSIHRKLHNTHTHGTVIIRPL